MSQVLNDRDSNDDVFDSFVDQWRGRKKQFRMDDPKVREQVLSVISVMMCLLSEAPAEVWQDFMRKVADMAKHDVPMDLQNKIMSRAKINPTETAR